MMPPCSRRTVQPAGAHGFPGFAGADSERLWPVDAGRGKANHSLRIDGLRAPVIKDKSYIDLLKGKEHALLAIDMESCGVALAASMCCTYSHPITHLVVNQRGP